MGVTNLLGVQHWRAAGGLDDPLALHDRLVRELPGSALTHFVHQCPRICKDPAFGRVLGLAPTPNEPARSGRGGRLGSHASGQLWRLAVILTRAAPLMGGTGAAECWLMTPAMGLDRRRPLDLLQTPAGYELVSDHLTQLEGGVYV